MAKWRIELEGKADPEYVEADLIRQDKNTGDYVFVLRGPAGAMVSCHLLERPGQVR